MATERLTLEIVTPEGVQLSVEVDEFTAPSVRGQFGVLPGHRPMLASLATGLISYIPGGGGEEEQVAVGPGHVQLEAGEAVVLTERFALKGSVDPVTVRRELKEVDQALEAFSGDFESAPHAELVARELWAAALLELYGDPPPPTMRGFRETPPPHDHMQQASDES